MSNKKEPNETLPEEVLDFFEPGTEHTPWAPFIYASWVQKRGMDDPEVLAMHKGKLLLSICYLVNFIRVIINN
jgi:hypothetical protein